MCTYDNLAKDYNVRAIIKTLYRLLGSVQKYIGLGHRLNVACIVLDNHRATRVRRLEDKLLTSRKAVNRVQVIGSCGTFGFYCVEVPGDGYRTTGNGQFRGREQVRL